MKEKEEIKSKEQPKENHCDCQKEHHEHCECHEQANHHNEHHEKKEIHKLKNKVHNLEDEVKRLEEKVKYHQAELINYRKRKDDETANLLKFSNQDLIMEIIPVLDNFERAIKLDDNNLSDELSKFLDGFKMMYVHLADILKRFGVEEIDCLGKTFDPALEEAMMIDEDHHKEDNVVLEILLKGYQLKGRVIRPAAVKVNKINEKGEDIHE